MVGAGPAGLMAAEVLQQGGVAVHVYDAMPSAGRKFLLAGKGGLNLTHSEPTDILVTRYGAPREQLDAVLREFDGAEVRAWAKTLGVETFVGTSGRVFPLDMKAAPLLRAWLHRLRHPVGGIAVQFHMRHRFSGWGVDGDELCFQTPEAVVRARAEVVVLALGGASWARLGSDGAWVPWLRERGVAVAPLRPANCGFDLGRLGPEHAPAQPPGWSAYFSARFAGHPFKSVGISFTSRQGLRFARKGEFVATATGVEGSLIYAASSLLRDEIAATGQARFDLDLLPDLSAQRVHDEVVHPRGSRSLSSHLKSRLHIDGIKLAVLHEVLSREQMNEPWQLASALKALPITLAAPRPIDEAISTAGGVEFEAMNARFMLERIPGVFCAGEMLDWEAPTGGYLLNACMATGRAAGAGALDFLAGANPG